VLTVTADQIAKIMPRAGKLAALYVTPLQAAMREFDIVTELRAEHYITQLAVESSQLTAVQEGLDYRAERLMVVWPSRFPTRAIADVYAHRPEAIANRVYANRGGNGNEASGDGWLFRGAGLISLTFRDNHAKCGRYFGIPLDQVGNWLRTPEGACRSAAWFWKTHGCNELADKDDIDGVSDAINLGHQTDKYGDAIGFVDRLAFRNVAARVIG
jgi:putative chitinase